MSFLSVSVVGALDEFRDQGLDLVHELEAAARCLAALASRPIGWREDGHWQLLCMQCYADEHSGDENDMSGKAGPTDQQPKR